MAESVIQGSIVDTARKMGWKVTVFSSDRRTRVARKSVPDLYLVHAGQQRQVWIECKDTGKEAREDQQEWIDSVLESGGEAYCCDSLDKALEVLM